MLTAYIPPTKWYKREHAWHFKIVLWPKWLAVALCDHRGTAEFFELNPQQKEWGVRLDCFDCGERIGFSDIGHRGKAAWRRRRH